jgi:4-alpha-glucanotransferase
MLFEKRAGILLHISSLPGKFGIGDIGNEAFKFIDFLVETGHRYWQILPLGPTSYSNSPYTSLSAFAGNPNLISIELLLDEGFLEEKDLSELPSFTNDKIDYALIYEYKNKIFRLSFKRFKDRANEELKKNFSTFCAENNFWLNDFTFFMAITRYYRQKGYKGDWSGWDKGFIYKDSGTIEKYSNQLEDEIKYHKFIQYIFFSQWFNLREYANERNIKIIGDLPMYIAYDSADVWANPEIFQLDENRKPAFVAGVPPDGFSEEGQLWGNPLYNWDELKNSDFNWLVNRLKQALKMVDMVRLVPLPCLQL